MDVMQPIATTDIPHGDEWLYEVKYDGFRCVLNWGKDGIKLMSRNNKNLTDKFPELINFCKANQRLVVDFLPLKFDGELVILNTAYQANFPLIQKRGRLKSKDSIKEAMETRPATFMAFDLLQVNGEDIYHKSFRHRKQMLNELSKTSMLGPRIRLGEAYRNGTELWRIIYTHK